LVEVDGNRLTFQDAAKLLGMRVDQFDAALSAGDAAVAHVVQLVPKRRREKTFRPRSVVTPDIVVAIRAEHAAGASALSLSRKYGLSDSCVCRIVHRETWRHVA
jgi:hypothetical protein